jgi:hypothetical protein
MTKCINDATDKSGDEKGKDGRKYSNCLTNKIRETKEIA